MRGEWKKERKEKQCKIRLFELIKIDKKFITDMI